MSKEDLIKKINEWYYPYWEGAASKEELILHVQRLYKLAEAQKKDEEFYRLKIQVLTDLSFNCMEEFSRGKYDQGTLTKKILEDLFYEFHGLDEHPVKREVI